MSPPLCTCMRFVLNNENCNDVTNTFIHVPKAPPSCTVYALNPTEIGGFLMTPIIFLLQSSPRLRPSTPFIKLHKGNEGVHFENLRVCLFLSFV